jgi:hypothetical protein
MKRKTKKKNDDQKQANRRRRIERERENFNAPSMNEISQYSKESRMRFDGKDTLERNHTERQRN